MNTQNPSTGVNKHLLNIEKDFDIKQKEIRQMTDISAYLGPEEKENFTRSAYLLSLKNTIEGALAGDLGAKLRYYNLLRLSAITLQLAEIQVAYIEEAAVKEKTDG